MLSQSQLIAYGIPAETATKIHTLYQNYYTNPKLCWQKIVDHCFQPRISFEAFKFLYETVYRNITGVHPAWFPTNHHFNATNLGKTLRELGHKDYASFYQWSKTKRENYWQLAIKKLNIQFKTPYKKICDLTAGIAKPIWLPEAKYNIVDSCFQAPLGKTAIFYQNEADEIKTLTYGELEILVNRIANSVSKYFQPGDILALDMPMNIEACAIYLGIIKAGCVVASIADSFASEEIATRLRITQAKAIFTQDYQIRADKKIPLYTRVIEAKPEKIIVLCYEKNTHLRPNDISFTDFLSRETTFTSVPCNAEDSSNILFSSGTTGEPKAIPWTHATPIKAAADAFFHLDATPDDVISWPTNLGWMMGPWLIYASLINQATIALYEGTPINGNFGQFVQSAKVSILGLVPIINNAWYTRKSMEHYHWDNLKCFGSTGECSNPEEYLYLMWLGRNKPIIEYCGGTEIGGAYVTSTLLQENTPSYFTTPALGLDFVLLDEKGELTNEGEVALIPPSIGLSNTLLNQDHFQAYYAGMPELEGISLRRHGDQLSKLNEFCYRAQGRIDDTMKLSGIKTSSAEIERLLNTLPEISETAAIAVSHNGPSKLIIYAVVNDNYAGNLSALKVTMQNLIKAKLNPLFKISDVILIKELPRTASNKVMRRTLRDQYQKQL